MSEEIVKKYRKKPVVIETCRLNKQNSKRLSEWCGGQHITNIDYSVSIVIETLEGDMRAEEGDWIIKGVHGEFYPCRNDIFEKTYEPA